MLRMQFWLCFALVFGAVSASFLDHRQPSLHTSVDKLMDSHGNASYNCKIDNSIPPCQTELCTLYADGKPIMINHGRAKLTLWDCSEDIIRQILYEKSNSISITELCIGSTNLSKLPDSLDTLTNLTHISLHYNVIHELGHESLHLPHLTNIEVKNSSVASLNAELFSSAPNLENVQMFMNSIHDVGHNIWTALSALTNLTSMLTLNKNDFRVLDNAVFAVITKATPTYINVSNNEISKGLQSSLPFPTDSILTGLINLRSNRIHNLNDLFGGWGYDKNETESWVRAGIFSHLLISGNPLVCDCHDCHIYQAALDSCTNVLFDADATCDLNGQSVILRTMDQHMIENMHCPYDMDDCPDGFKCFNYSCNKTIMVQAVDSPGTNITSMPSYVPYLTENGMFVINISGAFMIVLQNTYYLNRTRVLRITKSYVQWIPADFLKNLAHTIEVLDLSGNELAFLPIPESGFPNLKSLHLYKNNWNCNCSLIPLRYLITNHRMIMKHEVLCSDPAIHRGKILAGLSDSTLVCWQKIAEGVGAAIAAVVLIALVRVTYNRRFWFYVKYDLHPFDRDECTNEDKRFDIFLSYSSDDQELVNDLIEKLTAQNYRVCNHVTDFIIGENIFNNMSRAILYSKRTVCVVTQNFVNSTHCMFEFEMAQSVDMMTNKKRLIVIMTEDIEDPPNDIRHYKNHFTYLAWDCPFFMKRLTYRLAQNKLGPADESESPLLISGDHVNYGAVQAW